MTLWIELTAAAFGVLGTVLLALNGPRAGWGFVAYLVSNAGWILFAWKHAHWGLLAQQLAFTASSLLGAYVWLWKPQRTAESANKSSFKVEYVPAYKKIPLLVKETHGHRQVGWVSDQRAYLVKNIHMGWVAFIDQQTPENIDTWFCPHCRAAIFGSWREKIEKAMKS